MTASKLGREVKHPRAALQDAQLKLELSSLALAHLRSCERCFELNRQVREKEFLLEELDGAARGACRGPLERPPEQVP